MPPGAAWCPRCLAPRTAAAPAPEVGANGFLVTPHVVRTARRAAGSRWQASAVSFGPAGRLVMTVLLLLPSLWFFFLGVFGPLGFILWTFVVLPVALRDVWRHVPSHRR